VAPVPEISKPRLCGKRCHQVANVQDWGSLFVESYEVNKLLIKKKELAFIFR